MSPMSTARVGAEREYRVRDEMVEAGWHYDSRARGSKGAVDLWMSHDDRGGACVQVGSRTKRLGPADRARLLAVAERWGAIPVLAVYVPRQPITYTRVTLTGGEAWQP